MLPDNECEVGYACFPFSHGMRLFPKKQDGFKRANSDLSQYMPCSELNYTQADKAAPVSF